MKILRNQKGFTLIELVLIIIILGILSAVAFVQFGNLSDSARDAAIDGAYGALNSQLAIGIGSCRSNPAVASGAGDCNPTASDFSGDFATVVLGKVTFSGDLQTGAYGTPGAGQFGVCSGSAGNGRRATATYSIVGSQGQIALGAKATWAAGACSQ